MSVTILTRVRIKDGALRPNAIEAIRDELDELDRGRLDEYHAQIGRYDFYPTDLHLTTIREVGLSGQDGNATTRLVAQDALAAVRRVCPIETVEVHAIELECAESHYLESAPMPLDLEIS
jgi:hypothetical protein